MSGVAAQWSLDASSSSALTITRGLVAAATSDNVQPTAILACERLGGTLAMSSETISKVEKIIVPSPPPAPLQFLKAQVGFFKNDCASYLGRNDAGVRFLGLAAAIGTTYHDMSGVRALEMALRESGLTPTEMPTLRHLRDLLSSLSHRCHRAGFANIVAGWQVLLESQLGEALRASHPEAEETIIFKKLSSYSEGAPGSEILSSLIKVCCQVARIGESTIIGATITTGTSIPWIVAFTKWCLGSPPTIVLGSGTPIIRDEKSRIKLIIDDRLDTTNVQSLEVIIQHDLGPRLDPLFTQLPPVTTKSECPKWSRMLNLRTYGTWEIRRSPLLIREALRHVVPTLMVSLSRPLPELPKTSDIRVSKMKAYAGTSELDDAYTALFGGEPPNWQPVGPKDVKSLPSVRELSKKEPSGTTLEALSEVLKYIGCLALNLIAISLLDHPTAALVYSNNCVSQETRNHILRAIRGMLSSRRSVPSINTSIAILPNELLEWARGLFGQHVTNPHGTLLTSGRGQVLYPSVFGHFQIRHTAFYHLTVIPGQLVHDGSIYHSVQDVHETNNGTEYSIPDGHDLPHVITPMNLYPGSQVHWVVHASVQHVDVLQAGLVVTESLAPRRFMQPALKPSRLLQSPLKGIIVECCSHAKDRSIPAPNGAVQLSNEIVRVHFDSIGGTQGWRDFESDDSCMFIKPVEGSNDLRLFALACYEEDRNRKVVVRGNGCVACCLEFCKATRFKAVIL